MKEYLLTPGPTWIPDRIFAAMAKGTMHHRTSEFEKEFKEALAGLVWLTECEEPPILLSASGSGAMEAALLNTMDPGDKVIILNAGVFGERWVKICKKIGLVPVEIKGEPGTSPSFSTIESILAANPDAKGFCVQYSETSTTVLHPVPEISKLLQKKAPDLLFIVDAVSALATMDISVKKLKIDILVAGSQKGLMLPPGLSMLMMSPRGWSTIEKKKVRSFYFDLLAEREQHLKNTTAWTPAMNLILGLNEAIRMLKEEGIQKVYERHAHLSQVTRAGLSGMGFKLLTQEFPAPAVTGAYPPEGIDSEWLRKEILTKSGVRIAGGQAGLQGKIIRIGHMGYVNQFDILTAITAIELALKGKSKNYGAGVAAALAQCR